MTDSQSDTAPIQPTPQPEAAADAVAGGGKIGPYTLIRELDRQHSHSLHEATHPEHGAVEVEIFGADFTGWERHLAKLTALAPFDLIETGQDRRGRWVAWHNASGYTLAEYAAASSRPQAGLDALRLLVLHLEENEMALSDAEIRMVDKAPTSKRGMILAERPELASEAVLSRIHAHPPRPQTEIHRLNAPILRPILGRRARRNINWAAPLFVLPGLLSMAGAAWVGYEALTTYLNPPVGTVSEVSGKPANEAAQELAKAGFRVAFTEGEGNAAIGAVLRQEPEGNTNLPLGRLVTLTVNSPPDLMVPQVENLSVDRAKVNLQEGGFRLGTVTTIDGSVANIPEGRIISQTPPAGLATQRGQKINLLVSSGVQGLETWVPDLTGLDFASAREHARTAGLVLTQVKTEESELPPNTVISQSPAPYARSRSGDQMRLVVAASRYSPPPTTVGALPVPSDSTYTPIDQPQAPFGGVAPARENTVSTTGPTGTKLRNVPLKYTFPDPLPEGNYSIAVDDENGRRILMTPTPHTELAGAEAASSVEVTGSARFTVLRNNEEFASFGP